MEHWELEIMLTVFAIEILSSLYLFTYKYKLDQQANPQPLESQIRNIQAYLFMQSHQGRQLLQSTRST